MLNQTPESLDELCKKLDWEIQSGAYPRLVIPKKKIVEKVDSATAEDQLQKLTDFVSFLENWRFVLLAKTFLYLIDKFIRFGFNKRLISFSWKSDLNINGILWLGEPFVIIESCNVLPNKTENFARCHFQIFDIILSKLSNSFTTFQLKWNDAVKLS